MTPVPVTAKEDLVVPPVGSEEPVGRQAALPDQRAEAARMSGRGESAEARVVTVQASPLDKTAVVTANAAPVTAPGASAATKRAPVSARSAPPPARARCRPTIHRVARLRARLTRSAATTPPLYLQTGAKRSGSARAPRIAVT